MPSLAHLIRFHAQHPFSSFRRLVFSAFLCASGPLPAAAVDESGALMRILVRKGILTTQEAEDVRLELEREGKAAPTEAVAGSKATDRLSVGMRLQMQGAALKTDLRDAADPVSTQQFFLRRIYLTLKAGLGPNWGAGMTYDFASGGFDEAIVEWKPSSDLTFNFGLRKVNVVHEERASSGNIKAIERSLVTRYFVEPNNGRRLGAASYRTGVFLDGRRGGHVVYSFAVTNPHRSEKFALASSHGDRTNNTPAFWGNVGLTGKLAGGSFLAGIGAGHLPDQGGAGNDNLGRGFDLSIYSVYADLTSGRFGLLTEYVTAKVERGASATRDASPWGVSIQPSLRLTRNLEAVVRYSYLDTDGRGVNLSDGVRSAPSGGVMNRLEEYYFGGNYYVMGNDMKLQLGLLQARSLDTTARAPAEAKTFGARSQMQLQF